MCSEWIWEQTAIIYLPFIDWLVFITETECVYCAVRTETVSTVQIKFKTSSALRVACRRPCLCGLKPCKYAKCLIWIRRCKFEHESRWQVLTAWQRTDLLSRQRRAWTFKGLIILLAPELFFFLISAHPVYKMWIIQVSNTLELWNKLHFEEEKKEDYIPCLKYSVPIFVE